MGGGTFQMGREGRRGLLSIVILVHFLPLTVVRLVLSSHKQYLKLSRAATFLSSKLGGGVNKGVFRMEVGWVK